MAATFDRRRIQAPETSYAPSFADDAAEGEAGPSRRRTDRAVHEARPIFLKAGLIDQANGSGYIESGGVKIACSVYGPRPKQPPFTPEGTLNLEIKFAPFASHPRRAPLRDTEPVPLSTLLYRMLLPCLQLHLLPKSSVDVFLLVLESDTVPNTLSAGFTVASAALANAGIPMSALGVGAVVAASNEESALLLDPQEAEEETAKGCLTLGVLPALGKVTSTWLTGEVDIEEMIDMTDVAVKGAKATHQTLTAALVEAAEEYEQAGRT